MQTTQDAPSLDLRTITDLDTLAPDELESLLTVYVAAFAAPPYSENYSADEARTALIRILRRPGGELVVGASAGAVVSVAGGYLRYPDTYFIDELAVQPELQGRGYGRATLAALLASPAVAGTRRQEICTTAENRIAIALYESAGFWLTGEKAAVGHRRTDNSYRVDTRVLLERSEGSTTEIQPNVVRRVVVAYPSGNTTALVFDQRLDDDRGGLNTAVMRGISELDPAIPEVEQCGFITTPNGATSIARVEMFGGEFCGNATRAAIWIVTGGRPYSGYVEVSGVDEPLRFTVADRSVHLDMPLPDYTHALTAMVAEGTLVYLEGIIHLVCDAQNQTVTPRQLLTRILADGDYGLKDRPAVGVTFFDTSDSSAQFCVWVKEVDTMFDETACGSGTSAIGVSESARLGTDQDIDVLQPSGSTIKTTYVLGRSGASARSTISGGVEILYDGELTLQ